MTTDLPASTPFQLPTAHGIIHGFLDGPGKPGPRPTVVICHGFKGFMEWGFFPHLATLLAERGILAVRFNFTGSGMRPGEDRASDLEGFRANTFTRERDDLDAVLAALLGAGEGPALAEGRVDPGAVGLFGHSRGGGTALLGASRGRFAEHIRALVTWAAVATYDRFDPATREQWRRRGELIVVNGRTGQEMALGLGLLEDLERHRDELDLESAAAKMDNPWLIVHGTEDEAVPVSEGERLHRAAATGSTGEQAATEWLPIDGAGHTFGAVHPFAGPTPHLIRALNATQTFFRRHLA